MKGDRDSNNLEAAAYWARQEYDGPPRPRRRHHGSDRACHEGVCVACAYEEADAEDAK